MIRIQYCMATQPLAPSLHAPHPRAMGRETVAAAGSPSTLLELALRIDYIKLQRTRAHKLIAEGTPRTLNFFIFLFSFSHVVQISPRTPLYILDLDLRLANRLYLDF